jgi:hypothetical protein
MACVGGENTEVEDDYLRRTPHLETSEVKVDLINFPPEQLYRTGETIDFSVVFSEDVYVSGTPQLLLKIDNNIRYARYKNGSSTSTLIFEYSIVQNDFSSIGISVDGLSSGAIRDKNNLDVSLVFDPISNSNVLINAFSPAIVAMGFTSSGIFTRTSNSILSIEVEYDNDVRVVGTPKLELIMGRHIVDAFYVSGTDTNKLIFQYTVTGTDLALDSVEIANSVDFNNGKITSVYGVDVRLDFSGQMTGKAVVIYPNMVAWYDAQDTSTMFSDDSCSVPITAGSNKIGCIQDKSGRNNTAIQATQGHKPELIENIINGHQGIRFDTGDDILSTENSTDFDQTGGLTIFVVYRVGTLDNLPRAILSKRLRENDSSFSLFQYTSNYMFLDIHSTGNRVNRSETLVLNKVYTCIVQFDGSRNSADRSYVYLNDVRTAHNSNFTTTRTSGGGLHLGSLNTGYGRSLGGDIGEIIIHRSALNTNTEMVEINEYLKSKWDL